MIMKKSKLLVIVLFAIAANSFSQNLSQAIVSTQGSFDKTESMTLEWTLGETYVETVSQHNTIFTQGFHQTFLNKSLNIHPTLANPFEIVVFPNPTNSLVNILINADYVGALNINVYDVKGLHVKEMKTLLFDSKITLNIADLPSGVYIIQFSNVDGIIANTKKIIKN